MTYDALVTIWQESEAFAVAARKGLAPKVPGCPEWTVRELVLHLGMVHRFHTAHVTRGVTTPPEPPDRPEPSDAGLLAWFDEGARALLAALRSVPPDLPAWNWAPHTPQVVAFWPRRMALETAVHRWDAESAHGDASGFALPVALDGVDELLTVMGPAHVGPDLPTGVAVVRATDGEQAWAVRMAPGVFEVLPEVPAAPDATVEGTATALLLALWGRIPFSGLVTDGDAALLDVLAS